ncbi:MAG: hypothetical protein ACXQS8_01710, partial [Candidatus Helarchaeales archaeon]
ITDFWVPLPHGHEDLENMIKERLHHSNSITDKRKYFMPLINYWAIDWNHDDTVFKHDFVSFDRKLGEGNVHFKAVHEYEKPGTRKVIVKVIDMFGGETSKELIISVDD